MAHRGSEEQLHLLWCETALRGDVTRGGETCLEFGVVANPLVEFFQGGGVVDVTVRLNSPYWFLLLVETSFEMRSPPSNLVFIWEGLTIPVPYTRRRDKTSSRPFRFGSPLQVITLCKTAHQIKANRPSSKKGCFLKWFSKLFYYEWDKQTEYPVGKSTFLHFTFLHENVFFARISIL